MTTTADHDPGVRAGRRTGEVDALRGFTLFGILIPNVVADPAGNLIELFQPAPRPAYR